MASVSCSKCKTSHKRPVGKKCAVSLGSPSPAIANPPPIADTRDNQMLTILQSLQSSMARIETRVTDLETDSSDSVHVSSEASGEAGGTMEQLPIPTMETLRSSDMNQREVQARLAQITEGVNSGSDYPKGDSNKTFKSGRNRGPETSAKHYVIWPHELVYIGASRNTAQYDSLTPVQFITGFLRSLQLAPSSDRENMLSYGIDLFQDAVDVNWEVARGANSVVLQEIEQGRLNWSDSEKLQRTRTLYTQRSQVSSTASKTVSDNGVNAVHVAKKIVCRYYNNGRCTQDSDHSSGGMLF